MLSSLKTIIWTLETVSHQSGKRKYSYTELQYLQWKIKRKGVLDGSEFSVVPFVVVVLFNVYIFSG